MPTAQGFNTSTELRQAWTEYECRPDRMVKVAFPTTLQPKNWPDGLLLAVARESAPAWLWFADTMDRYGVTIDEWASGTYNCRNVAGTNVKSSHAFGVAVDINPSRNPAGSTFRSDLPPNFVAEILALRTVSGRRVFRWGGDWDDDDTTSHSLYDAMHFEITCSPADLGTGLVEEPMALTPEQEQFVQDMYDFVVNGTRWVGNQKVVGHAQGSDGSFAGPAVDLVRQARNAPLHKHEGGTLPSPDLSAYLTRAEAAVTYTAKPDFNGHDHPGGTTGKPRKPL
jgi:hypothetical protein